MSNDKQSSVSSLITEIQRRVAIIQSEPQTMARELMIDNLSVDLEQYEAMHKEEIEDAELRGKEIIIIKHTEHSTPIELPSDDEIEEQGNLIKDLSMRSIYILGAMWMRDKIQGGNND